MQDWSQECGDPVLLLLPFNADWCPVAVGSVEPVHTKNELVQVQRVWVS